jgi:hypothetical protein
VTMNPQLLLVDPRALPAVEITDHPVAIRRAIKVRGAQDEPVERRRLLAIASCPRLVTITPRLV